MAEHSFYGKRRLCYTEVSDFSDFQGVGNDPMYKRFDSVYAVIDKAIKPEYKQFLAQPSYSDEDQIFWFVENWNETPCKLSDLDEAQKAHYEAIKQQTLQHYREVAAKLPGEDGQILSRAIKYMNDDFVFCYDNKVTVVAWGMLPDMNQHKVVGAIIKDLQFERRHKVRFDTGENGALPMKIDGVITRAAGTTLGSIDLPKVLANDGWEFVSWDPEPIGHKVTQDITFTAVYKELPKAQTPPVVETPPVETPPVDTPPEEPKKDMMICRFVAGDGGKLTGIEQIEVPYNTIIPAASIPAITAKKGYEFKGWDKPIDKAITSNCAFFAQYKKSRKGCWKVLLWILLGLLLALLLAWLLYGCSKGGWQWPWGNHGGGENTVKKLDPRELPDGTIGQNNGYVHDILDPDNRLPKGIKEKPYVSPIRGEEGEEPPIIHNPGAPDIIGDRLNIFFEDNDVDLNDFVGDFKRVYPDDDFQVIGADDNTKMITIQIPEDQRDVVREGINGQLPQYDFFVIDESILEISGTRSGSTGNNGWHLQAINLKQGWSITQGSSDIVVAIVDDGIDASHDMFKGRIRKPYNVFTQNNHLSTGDGHGTHVAGLAVGSDAFFDEGAAGVAPKCMLMPIQVFDNEQSTFSALASGIMYAIHNGADVINLSIAPCFSGLDMLPYSDQEVIAQTQFINEQRVYKKIFDIAEKKNVIIVWAAGNDNILAQVAPENRMQNTLNVAAVNANIEVTDFSNYSTGTNISAPGQDIYSAYPTNDFTTMDGTSMAAPIVTGTVALLKSVKPNLTVREIKAILQQSGLDLAGDAPPMVQVDKALMMAKNGTYDVNAPEPENRGNSSNVEPIPNIRRDPYTFDPEDPAAGNGQNQTDYDAIRRMIEEYKQKIRELEGQLPENQR